VTSLVSTLLNATPALPLSSAVPGPGKKSTNC